MFRKFFPVLAVIFLFSSCTGFKQLGTALNKQQAAPASLAMPQKQAPADSKSGVKFLEDISATANSNSVSHAIPLQSNNTELISTHNKVSGPGNFLPESALIKEPATLLPLQFKYAQLLQAEPNEIQNLELFEFIDYWYGTRYCMGGATQKCIDCSALVQIMYSDIFKITLPRTSKEQYKNTRRISLTELQEGDLLFFHTRGRGVSHVGVYLRNNKFVHASSSGGVMISDMYEPYFVKRLISAGRVDK